MTKCMFLQENSTIGQKISLTEKIVAVLPKVGNKMRIRNETDNTGNSLFLNVSI